MLSHPYPLYVLPTKQGCASANMADDLLLLESLQTKPCLYLRHYKWEPACVTFGYMQSYAWVCNNVSKEMIHSLQRRPTGGGIVEHGNDFTYSLIIPSEHLIYKAKACEVYRTLHESLQTALLAVGCRCELKACEPNAVAIAPTACFRKAEVYDLVNPQTMQKIAGAAQKRTRDGMLIQGSIAIRNAPEVENPDFLNQFTQTLASCLSTPIMQTDFPKSPKAHTDYWQQLLASVEWQNKRR